MNNPVQNEAWARAIIAHTDPKCRPRWEVFDAKIRELANGGHFCLNIGAGINEEFDLAASFGFSTDMDILAPRSPSVRKVPFIQADLLYLPFASNSFDLVLLRFVVEHISDPKQAMLEIERILKPGGQILILTTNLNSPFIFIPRLLPYDVRKWLMKILFRVDDQDIFPTYHRMNSPKMLRALPEALAVKELIYIQDINWNRKWLFILLYSFHIKTKILHLPGLRSNILARLQKLLPE